MSENTALASSGFNFSGLSQEALTREWEGTQFENVMDEILTIKLYNKNPTTNEPENPELAGKILYKSKDTEGEFIPFATDITINLLAVRKFLGGSFPMLDDAGNYVMDGVNAKQGFAFTEEYTRWTRNLDNVLFKNSSNNKIVAMQLGALKNLLKSPTIVSNGVEIANQFYEQKTTLDKRKYDSSFIQEGYMIYGEILSGEKAWEFFRMRISSGAFGSVRDAETNTYSDQPNSLSHLISEATKNFKNSGQKGSFSDSWLTCTLSPQRTEKGFYLPHITNYGIYQGDNSENHAYIIDLLRRHKEATFNVQQNTLPTGNVERPAITQAVTPEAQPTVQQWAQPGNGLPAQAAANPLQAQRGTAPAQPMQPTQHVQPVQTAPVKAGIVEDEISIEDLPFN